MSIADPIAYHSQGMPDVDFVLPDQLRVSTQCRIRHPSYLEDGADVREEVPGTPKANRKSLQGLDGFREGDPKSALGPDESQETDEKSRQGLNELQVVGKKSGQGLHESG